MYYKKQQQQQQPTLVVFSINMILGVSLIFSLLSFPQIAEVMLSQCKKKPAGDYKAVAIESAGYIIESLEVDVFSKLLAILPVTNPVST